MTVERLAAWLKAALPEGGTCGFDPWLHTEGEIARLKKALGEGISLKPVANPIDAVWGDRPKPPSEPIVVHPVEFAGEAALSKRGRVAAELEKAGAKAAVLTVPESICWLLNIRGSDIERTPVVLALLHISVVKDHTVLCRTRSRFWLTWIIVGQKGPTQIRETARGS